MKQHAAVIDSLHAGERVATQGMDKTQDSMRVRIAAESPTDARALLRVQRPAAARVREKRTGATERVRRPPAVTDAGLVDPKPPSQLPTKRMTIAM